MLKKCTSINHQTLFKFKNPLYALDSSTINLCSSVLDWAKFRRTKGGISLHFLFDIKSQIPVFNVVKTAKEADVNVAKKMKLKLTPDSILTFERAYFDFNLFQSYKDARCFFVTRTQSNLQFELLGQLLIPKKKGLQFDHVVQIKNPI
ncbi:transposase, partial [bacterium]|nr:transposase [bacterium]